MELSFQLHKESNLRPDITEVLVSAIHPTDPSRELLFSSSVPNRGIPTHSHLITGLIKLKGMSNSAFRCNCSRKLRYNFDNPFKILQTLTYFEQHRASYLFFSQRV